MPPHPQWYPYDMANYHLTRHSPPSPEIAQPPLPAKTVFDKTNPPVVFLRPETTTYGRKCPFRPFPTDQNCADYRYLIVSRYNAATRFCATGSIPNLLCRPSSSAFNTSAYCCDSGAAIKRKTGVFAPIEETSESASADIAAPSNTTGGTGPFHPAARFSYSRCRW